MEKIGMSFEMICKFDGDIKMDLLYLLPCGIAGQMVLGFYR
jgi:hypothetical protein